MVIGILSTLWWYYQTINGRTNFADLIWVVLGAFLLCRANKKNEEEEDKKKQWITSAIRLSAAPSTRGGFRWASFRSGPSTWD